MEIGILLALSTIFLIIIIVQGLYSRKRNSPSEQVQQSQIQKHTYLLCFSTSGNLIYVTPGIHNNPLISNFESGNHISTFTGIENIEKYFERCIQNKKNFSIKLTEDTEGELMKRTDLFFTPFIQSHEVIQVVLMIQESWYSKNFDNHISQKIELEEQRNYALKQIDVIEAQKHELEQAFKKSSKHHIMLQKALHKIESQNNELEKALETINNQKLELEKANQEIRESSQMKEIFLANTSHEIRTPLNAIIGFTNLLSGTQLNDTQEKYITNIKASGNNLLVVINDILDFSKIESGKLTLEQIDFDFRNLIKHTISTLSVKTNEKEIDLTYDIGPDVPEVINGDPVRLNQILINLLGNSIKFTPNRGFVKLKATMGQPDNNRVKILFKVEDNGIGIPADKFDQIFLSFTQGESNTTRKYGGTGLGLSIVKQLIKLHDGDISVESELGKGTAFTFYLMLMPGNNISSTHIAHKDPPLNQPKPSGLRLLLVEDNLINQQLAVDTIKAWNSDAMIDVAVNGRIALEKVMANHYHLVLMDIQMPEMDGNEATIKIRELPEPKCHIPIVAMTAHALKSEKTNCLNMGMNDYISKPFDPEELFAKIIQYSGLDVDKTKPNETLTSIDAITNEPTFTMEYKYINLINLRKIYQNNNDKILKIVGMCYDSIPNEIEEIQNAFKSAEWQALKAKSHALKPKFGYLGLFDLQETAKNIEILALEDNTNGNLVQSVEQLNQGWLQAKAEIKHLIDTKNL